MAGRVSPARRKFLREESEFILPDNSAFQTKGDRRIFALSSIISAPPKRTALQVGVVRSLRLLWRPPSRQNAQPASGLLPFTARRASRQQHRAGEHDGSQMQNRR